MNPSAYGLDIGLTNGSLIKLTKTDQGPSYTTVKNWSTPQDLDKLSDELVSKVLMDPAPVAIDWTPNALYRRTPALQLVKTGYLVGELTFGFRTGGVNVFHVPTYIVRKAFCLPAKASKEVVQSTFLSTNNYDFGLQNKHSLDALILAWLLVYPTHVGSLQGLML